MGNVFGNVFKITSFDNHQLSTIPQISGQDTTTPFYLINYQHYHKYLVKIL